MVYYHDMVVKDEKGRVMPTQQQNPLIVSRKDFVSAAILFFTALVAVYSSYGKRFEMQLLNFTLTAPDYISTFFKGERQELPAVSATGMNCRGLFNYHDDI